MNNNRVVLAKKGQRLYYGYYKDGVPTELYACKNVCDGEEPGSILGNVYVARVEKCAPGIKGAFLETVDGACFFPFRQNEKIKKLSPGHEDGLYGGDLILVQIIKDAVKTKLPVASANVSISGRYFVLTLADQRYAVSKKISDSGARKELLSLLEEYRSDSYGIIARTNSAGLPEEILREELTSLIAGYETIIKKAAYASAKSLVYKEAPHCVTFVKELPKDEIDEIVTDDHEIYEQYLSYYKNSSTGEMKIPVRFYKDDYSLFNLYRMAHYYEEASSKYVYLPSGGSLVIEPTEAMTVIDVNTGAVLKGRQKKEEVYYQTNREAAKEIARQLRLRNLSGIIVIDFINMKEVAEEKKIFDLLTEEVNKDRIRTRVIDITGLGLMEVTRSKIMRPLSEQLR